MRKNLFILLFFILPMVASTQEPVPIGIAGLSHSHVVPLLRDMDRSDIRIVGIAESDQQLVDRYVERFNIDPELIYNSLEKMLAATDPAGVVTFTSIYEHLEVVKACAPRGIHVMVEKPLAVSVDHATKMISLAEKHGVLLLTNYETTWYPSIYKVSEMMEAGDLGTIRKVIVYDGHRGPSEINVNKEFLDWLTDPVMNGGGAVIDFGCYGADLITWLLSGERPTSVYATLKQYKPDVYPNVDDDATIVLTYSDLECIIHASWNWPFSRKDMHVYGNTGYVYQDDPRTIRYRLDREEKEQRMEVAPEAAPFTNAFSFFSSAIRGETMVQEYDLSSPATNLIVVEILEAAKKSHSLGKEVFLDR